ncbi:ATP-binding protein [Clostridium sp. 19966]|uniref:ATP-binding protein n=1 Tax=Clostridium sp. 19966 TaxID=2768166 RepID=UPI0028EE046C|nr:ATP-binding protein [Clostridium sp. 19966]
MQRFKPQVKDISLYKEIAQNIVNPLEILREGISNSHDAEAKNISIILDRNSSGNFVVEIQDDGKGMELDNIHRFFNMGDSDKALIGIGEKGLGTKTYFKSKRITIYTQTEDNEAYKAVMETPWEALCNNILPEYSVERYESKSGNKGTTILIEDYVIDNPEKYFNFEIVKDYVLWFTAAGSFKTYFANYMELHKYISNMQIAPRILIQDRISNIKEEIAGVHQFSEPQEDPRKDFSEPIYKRTVNYCRHFGPFHKPTNIDGEFVSFEIYGTISGVNRRRSIAKLRQGETLKSRFGIYLAKDFIPFTKKNDLISDPNVHHFHLLVNSQAFELTADRNNLSNINDKKVKWVLEEAKKVINECIIPLANEGYFKMRKAEEALYEIGEKQRKIIQRVESFNELANLNIDSIPIIKRPDNESQVALLFTALMSNKDTKKLVKGISKIGHYSHQSSTDMICIDNNNNRVLAEIEYILSNLFKHDHPFDTFDYVICWRVDLLVNEKRTLADGNTLCLIRENDEWMLKYGARKIIPVIELKSIIDAYNNHSNKATSTNM